MEILSMSHLPTLKQLFQLLFGFAGKKKSGYIIGCWSGGEDVDDNDGNG